MPPRTLLLFPCPPEDLADTDSYDDDSNPRTPILLNLFPCQPGDLSRPLRYDPRAENDVWKIKITLTMSDFMNQTRLLIPMEDVEKHVLKHLTRAEIRMVQDEINQGLMVDVYDNDTKTTHTLCFQRSNSTHSYVLSYNWNRDFVHRRNLQEGDKIGLFWNFFNSRFHFKVLARSRFNQSFLNSF